MFESTDKLHSAEHFQSLPHITQFPTV